MGRLIRYGKIGWEVIQSFLADKCTILAAGLCFFFLLSLFPFLLVTVAVMGFFLSAEEAMIQASRLITQLAPEAHAFLMNILAGLIEHRGEATLVGLVTLLWSAKNVFFMMGQALNIIWDIPKDRGPIVENLVAIGFAISVGAFGFFVGLAYAIMMAVMNFRIPLIGFSPSDIPGFVFLIVNLVPVTTITLVLMALYTFLPNMRLSWQQVLPGALVAAVSWEAGRRVFSYYLENMAKLEAVYGSISGLIGFLIWVFLSANLFLLGAEVAWVLNQHHREGKEEEAVTKKPLSGHRA